VVVWLVNSGAVISLSQRGTRIKLAAAGHANLIRGEQDKQAGREIPRRPASLLQVIVRAGAVDQIPRGEGSGKAPIISKHGGYFSHGYARRP